MLIKQKFRSFFSATFSGLPMSACGFSFFFFFFFVSCGCDSCNGLSPSGCKERQQRKDSFMACHLDQLLLVCTSPKMFFISSIDYSSSAIWISQKRTEFTSPIAKSTSPGLPDTTFFARCPFVSYYYYSPLKYGCSLFNACFVIVQKILVDSSRHDFVMIVTFHLFSLLPTNHIMI